jgi:transmembrane sensor
MSVTNKQVRELITEQAADWFVANRAGLTERDRADFAAWLRASPAHVEEYLSIATLSRDLRAACDHPENSIEQIIARAQSGERIQPFYPHIDSAVGKPPTSWWPRAAVTLAAMAVLSVGLYFTREYWLPGLHRPVDVTTLHFETRHGEQQTIMLADNSILHLNTDSSATVRYGRSERSVRLVAGEAHLQIVHEPARPFHVFAGTVDILDVGTQFDVRFQHEAVLVTVVEGRLAVSLRADQRVPLRTMQLEANQQLEITAAGMPDMPMLVDAQRATAWLHRQIVFEDEPLVLVAEEFNRYSAKPIEIISPSLQNLRISGVFATDDTDAFIAFLRSLEGVRVEVTPTRIRVSQR